MYSIQNLPFDAFSVIIFIFDLVIAIEDLLDTVHTVLVIGYNFRLLLLFGKVFILDIQIYGYICIQYANNILYKMKIIGIYISIFSFYTDCDV